MAVAVVDNQKVTSSGPSRSRKSEDGDRPSEVQAKSGEIDDISNRKLVVRVRPPDRDRPPHRRRHCLPYCGGGSGAGFKLSG